MGAAAGTGACAMSRPDPHSRERILERLRGALGSGDDPARRVEVLRRLNNPRENLVPARAGGSRAEIVQQFAERMRGQQATVEQVASAAEIPARVTAYLREHNLPSRLRSSAAPELMTLPWTSEPQLEIATGKAIRSDDVAIGYAFAAAAETGTLVMTSGEHDPTTLSFLPDNHIVVVEASRIDGSYEAVWRRLRTAYGDRTLPRSVNYISGPSRTGDIEGIIVMGAHGPRRLHVIVAGTD
jgi:L-lactate dehydrogenase complex protein LldG